MAISHDISPAIYRVPLRVRARQSKMTHGRGVAALNISAHCAYGIQTRQLSGVMTNASGNSIIFGPWRSRHL